MQHTSLLNLTPRCRVGFLSSMLEQMTQAAHTRCAVTTLGGKDQNSTQEILCSRTIPPTHIGGLSLPEFVAEVLGPWRSTGVQLPHACHVSMSARKDEAQMHEVIVILGSPWLPGPTGAGG